VFDLETSRICAPYIYDLSSLRVNKITKYKVETECQNTTVLHIAEGCI